MVLYKFNATTKVTFKRPLNHLKATFMSVDLQTTFKVQPPLSDLQTTYRQFANDLQTSYRRPWNHRQITFNLAVCVFSILTLLVQWHEWYPPWCEIPRHCSADVQTWSDVMAAMLKLWRQI